MTKDRSLRATLCAGMFLAVASSTARAAEVRGSLQGVATLHPSPPPPVTGTSPFYWEEPNGALDVRPSRANPEFDLAVVLTGPGVPEASQPVDMPVVGGRCRPGTVVVSPNTVLRVINRGWMPHEFFATAQGQTTPVRSFAPEATPPSSMRQVQFPEAGTYELHDRLQPQFRCWIVVGPGQGRQMPSAADSSFSVPNLADGDYTVRVYFEGRQLSETPAHVAASGSRPVVLPAINLAPPGAAPAAAGGAGATPPPPPGGATGTPPPATAPAPRGGH